VKVRLLTIVVTVIKEIGQGKLILKPKYDAVGVFSDGLAAVNLGANRQFPGRQVGGSWGYVDQTGREAIKHRFGSAGAFSNGIARVNFGGKVRYIDRTGRFVEQPKPSRSAEALHDLRVARRSFPTRSIRFAKGRTAKHNDAEAFAGPLARVQIGGRYHASNDGPAAWSGGTWYYVNRDGLVVHRIRSDQEDGPAYGKEFGRFPLSD